MGMTIDDAIKIFNTLLAFHNVTCTIDELEEVCKMAIDAMSKYQQLEKFARWVAVEVIDEDMWTLNHLSFAELACRKLVKLGIMQESNEEYLYEEVNNGNDDRGNQCSTSQG